MRGFQPGAHIVPKYADGGLVQRALGLLGGRKKQIDEAVKVASQDTRQAGAPAPAPVKTTQDGKFDEKRASKEFSLKLDDRLAMARREDEMSAYLNDVFRDDDEDEDKDAEDDEDQADLILDETLLILADLITLSEEKKQVPDDAQPAAEVAKE